MSYLSEYLTITGVFSRKYALGHFWPKSEKIRIFEYRKLGCVLIWLENDFKSNAWHGKTVSAVMGLYTKKIFITLTLTFPYFHVKNTITGKKSIITQDSTRMIVLITQLRETTHGRLSMHDSQPSAQGRHSNCPASLYRLFSPWKDKKKNEEKNQNYYHHYSQANYSIWVENT